jgi:peptidoglycan/xylan/chitin deacetylase (PgdA/CDA1 family)
MWQDWSVAMGIFLKIFIVWWAVYSLVAFADSFSPSQQRHTASFTLPLVTSVGPAVALSTLASTNFPAPTGASTHPSSRSVIIPILMYHYVRVVTNPRDVLGIRLSVTPPLFAAQMQYLADNGYTTLTMRDVYAILAGQQALPRKPVALTFDDGYADFYSSAWPVLNAHHFKATSYIITSFVGHPAYMSWDQIRTLDASGMVDFGAHTRDHPDLRSLSATRLWSEVDGSKIDLEQHLGHAVVDFCYPSGEYNSRVLAAVKSAGYETATTTHPGDLDSLQAALTLPRVRVTGTDSLRTWEKRIP